MGVLFPGKKRYEGVRRGQIPRKKRYVTLEWPLVCIYIFIFPALGVDLVSPCWLILDLVCVLAITALRSTAKTQLQ